MDRALRLAEARQGGVSAGARTIFPPSYRSSGIVPTAKSGRCHATGIRTQASRRAPAYLTTRLPLSVMRRPDIAGQYCGIVSTEPGIVPTSEAGRLAAAVLAAVKRTGGSLTTARVYELARELRISKRQAPRLVRELVDLGVILRKSPYHARMQLLTHRDAEPPEPVTRTTIYDKAGAPLGDWVGNGRLSMFEPVRGHPGVSGPVAGPGAGRSRSGPPRAPRASSRRSPEP
jgi:hypothetical protein